MSDPKLPGLTDALLSTLHWPVVPPPFPSASPYPFFSVAVVVVVVVVVAIVAIAFMQACPEARETRTEREVCKAFSQAPIGDNSCMSRVLVSAPRKHMIIRSVLTLHGRAP